MTYLCPKWNSCHCSVGILVTAQFLLKNLFLESLFELRDFRIARVTPKGEATEQFAASMHLVLDLADKYPRDSVAAHIALHSFSLHCSAHVLTVAE